MSERVRFIEHAGKKILFIDFTNCSHDEGMHLLADIQATVEEQPRGSLLIFADFHGAQFDRQIATRIKEVLVFDRPYVKRSAWIGTETVPHVFYENFKRFSQRELPIFASREEALAWLVQED
ncbi:MAG TPA: hypothetical protein VF753_10735 [Terriglobales bacterium]